MSHTEVIRAWKDENYLLSLNEAERAQLPANPAGMVEFNVGLMAHAGGDKGPANISLHHCSIVIECSASNCG